MPHSNDLKPVIIYHADCYDGFTAAWIAHHALGGDVELVPAKYGQAPPWTLIEDRRVWVLDFSYERDAMVKMDSMADSLIVLDHHKTAEENCRGLDFCEFDMERSGAGMTWDDFHPGRIRPVWIDCVEDRDLWRFEHPATESIHAYLTSIPMTIAAWSEIAGMEWEHIADGGIAIRRSIQRYCEKMAEHAQGRILWGCPAQVVNAPYLNCSELCNYLLEAESEPSAVAVAYFQRRDGMWQFSLRSKKGETDVSRIAKTYGGGGHASAAGFAVETLSNVLGSEVTDAA